MSSCVQHVTLTNMFHARIATTDPNPCHPHSTASASPLHRAAYMGHLTVRPLKRRKPSTIYYYTIYDFYYYL